jgi:4'-phosphopantetheinyl transferase
MEEELLTAVTWQAPVVFPWLHEGEVHIWRFETQPSDFRYDKMLGLLSAKEKQRAFRYKFEKDRREFVMARGALRLITGGYLQREAQRVVFTENEFGKPALVNGKRFVFNVSHSHGLILIAVAKNCAIGVDVEKVQELDHQAMAQRFFAKDERKMLQALTPSEQLQAFFLCWTRKEALVKAVGEGLSYPLDQFVVSVDPAEPAQILKMQESDWKWRVWDMSELPRYAAALVCDRADMTIKYWQWQYCIMNQAHNF